MAGGVADRIDALQGYPTLSASAKMLGISPSTLSRREDLTVESRGERDKVLRATEVMRMATIYRKRSLNEVAADLLAHVRAEAPNVVGTVDEEIEEFVEQVGQQPRSEVEELLDLAERNLPAKMVAEIRRAVNEDGGQRRPSLVGNRPS